MLKKICHIRGNKNYWETFNVFDHWKTNRLFPLFEQFNNYWNNLLNIPHMRFRKLIRDLVINHIRNVNCFDEILEDNKSCHDYFNNNSHEVILFQQDDDDIFLELPKTIPGLNIFEYSHIDVNTLRRSVQYNKRKNFKNNKLRKIQSNHVIINNENLVIDFNLYKLWDAGHTIYDNIIPSCNNNYIHFDTSNFSIHFYHLFSVSALYSFFKKNDYDILCPKEFIKLTNNYINRLNTFSTNAPLIRDFKQLYNKLLI